MEYNECVSCAHRCVCKHYLELKIKGYTEILTKDGVCVNYLGDKQTFPVMENELAIFDGYEKDHKKALDLIVWQNACIKDLKLALKTKDEMLLDMMTRHVGEWQITTMDTGTLAHIKCSNCGHNDTVQDERCDFIRVLPKYCPKCGAKMKGGE